MVKRPQTLDGACKSCASFGAILGITFAIFIFSGTGDHGVGMGRKEFSVEELGDDLMKTIEWVIDPLGIINSGKVWPHAYATPRETSEIITHFF